MLDEAVPVLAEAVPVLARIPKRASVPAVAVTAAVLKPGNLVSLCM
jgi:hypothetical protein